MPSVVLEVVAGSYDTAGRQTNDGAGPLFTGTGDIDYLCGNCGFVIAESMAPTQHFVVDQTDCPACSATNAFPADLRA